MGNPGSHFGLFLAVLGGVGVGFVLTLLVTIVPMALLGEGFYEAGDSLIVMGIPLILAGGAAGALVGLRGWRR